MAVHSILISPLQAECWTVSAASPGAPQRPPYHTDGLHETLQRSSSGDRLAAACCGRARGSKCACMAWAPMDYHLVASWRQTMCFDCDSVLATWHGGDIFRALEPRREDGQTPSTAVQCVIHRQRVASRFRLHLLTKLRPALAACYRRNVEPHRSSHLCRRSPR